MTSEFYSIFQSLIRLISKLEIQAFLNPTILNATNEKNDSVLAFHLLFGIHRKHIGLSFGEKYN